MTTDLTARLAHERAERAIARATRAAVDFDRKWADVRAACAELDAIRPSDEPPAPPLSVCRECERIRLPIRSWAFDLAEPDNAVGCPECLADAG